MNDRFPGHDPQKVRRRGQSGPYRQDQTKSADTQQDARRNRPKDTASRPDLRPPPTAREPLRSEPAPAKLQAPRRDVKPQRGRSGSLRDESALMGCAAGGS
ncbi:hypothetical protein GCM10010530_19940 [Kribbella aluminosa]